VLVLRSILIAIGIAMLALAAWLAGCGAPAASLLGLIIFGAILSLGTLLERGAYKEPKEGHPGAGWIDTGERFFDPETGRKVAVFYQPHTGERTYVHNG